MLIRELLIENYQNSLKAAMAQSKNRTSLKNWIRGIVFCSLWFFSIWFGFLFLICPLLPLVIFNIRLYRRYSDLVFAMWELFPVGMMEIFFGVRIKVDGDMLNPFEGSIIIMNHRTRVDWNFLWGAMFHCSQPLAHNMKFVLKAPIMHLPGPGWVMQACSFLFIHRSWLKDQHLISKMLDHLNETDSVSQILIFPEGTDLTPKNIVRSHKYADDHGLERYYRVLHPKTTGFVFLANRMRQNGQLHAVYDMTVGYPKTTPETELDMLRGRFPEELHFYVKRYDVSHLPLQEAQLKNWLNEVWLEKEKKLQRFFSNGSFVLHNCTPDCFVQNSTNELLNKCSMMHNTQQNIEINQGKKDTSDFDHGTKCIHNEFEDEANEVLYNYCENAENENMINKKKQMIKNANIPKYVDNNKYSNKLHFETNDDEYIPKMDGPQDQNYLKDDHLNFKNNLNDLNFDGSVKRHSNVKYRSSHTLHLALLFWISFIIFSFYIVFSSFVTQIWCIFHILIFVILSFTSPGFHQLVASFTAFKTKLFTKNKKCV